VTEPLLPKHGGYRKLKSFQVAQLLYDVTARFCDRYIDRRSRTHDQMVQAARSGGQNIAEGQEKGGHIGPPLQTIDEIKYENECEIEIEPKPENENEIEPGVGEDLRVCPRIGQGRLTNTKTTDENLNGDNL
jgi:hypothetical protein